jgi:hypothetical protein
MKFDTKDVIAFRINDIFMKEGVIVGSVSCQDKIEYRVLHGDKIFDVREEDIVSLEEWDKYATVE